MEKTTFTIMTEGSLLERVNKHCKARGESLTEFYTRAILNQLEKDGDFEARDTIVQVGERDSFNVNEEVNFYAKTATIKEDDSDSES